MPAPRIVRVVVDGRTYRQRHSDNFAEARDMLSAAVASDSWPSRKASFAITPGGFIRTSLPRSYRGRRGWDSRRRDLNKLIPHAQAAVDAVVRGEILDAARQRTRFLTLGVDLNGDRNKEDRIRGDHKCGRTCPQSCTHAELVAVLDTTSGQVMHWTGKSNPTKEQQHSTSRISTRISSKSALRVSSCWVATTCTSSAVAAGARFATPHPGTSGANGCLTAPKSSSRR